MTSHPITLHVGRAVSHYAIEGVWWQRRAARLTADAADAGPNRSIQYRGMAVECERYARVNFRRAHRMAQRAANRGRVY